MFKKEFFDNFEKKLDHFIKLPFKSINWNIFYLIFLLIFVLILVYEFIYFIVNLPFYSFSRAVLFFIFISLVFLIYKNLKLSRVKSFIINNWRVLLFLWFIFYFCSNLFLIWKYSFWFLTLSSISLLWFYLILRFVWFRFDYDFFKNDIKKDDFLSFYTIFIVSFLFLSTFIFSFEQVSKYRSMFAFLSFLIVSFSYVYIFNRELLIENLNNLNSRKNRIYLKKIKYLVLFFAIFIFGFWFYYLNLYNKFWDEIIKQEEIVQIQNNISVEDTKPVVIEQKIEETQIKNLPKTIQYITIWEYYNFERYIWIGNYWEDVKVIQEILRDDWFYFWEINSKFDKLTSESLDKFIEARTWNEWNFSLLWPKTMEVFKSLYIQKK